MLEHLLLLSIPNLMSIYAADALFCMLFPLRENAKRRIAVAVALCLGISCASAVLQTVIIPSIATLGPVAELVPHLAFFVLVLLSCIPLSRMVFELGTWDAIFCCTAGYVLQNTAHLLWQAIEPVVLGGVEHSQAASTLGQLLVFLLAAAVAYATFVRRIREQHLEGSGDARVLFAVCVVILANITLDTITRRLVDAGTAPIEAIVGLYLSQLLISGLTLALEYVILYSARMRADAATARQLAEDERRQYQLSKDTIDAINQRCHDIKHQIRHWQANGAADAKVLEGVSDLVSIYDAGIKTGNAALDTILTEKSLVCRNEGITLTATVDGRPLSFMDEADIYSLFGNALDNAIEALRRVTDPDRLILDVSTRTAGGMVDIQVRNFYEGELRFANGLPQTTKTDGGLHGYGTKSIRATARRYGGDASIDASDGMFRLSVLLPIPAK